MHGRAPPATTDQRGRAEVERLAVRLNQETRGAERYRQARPHRGPLYQVVQFRHAPADECRRTPTDHERRKDHEQQLSPASFVADKVSKLTDTPSKIAIQGQASPLARFLGADEALHLRRRRAPRRQYRQRTFRRHDVRYTMAPGCHRERRRADRRGAAGRLPLRPGVRAETTRWSSARRLPVRCEATGYALSFWKRNRQKAPHRWTSTAPQAALGRAAADQEQSRRDQALVEIVEHLTAVQDAGGNVNVSLRNAERPVCRGRRSSARSTGRSAMHPVEFWGRQAQSPS